MQKGIKLILILLLGLAIFGLCSLFGLSLGVSFIAGLVIIIGTIFCGGI